MCCSPFQTYRHQLAIYRKSILEITVFACGALVMVFEIIGSRILSPFIGTSTYVWTSLIGVILASLSVGYWYGGRLADRQPDPRILASVIFAAGSLVAITVLIKDIVMSFIAAAPVGLELKSVFAAVLLFAPASVCLGFVAPFAVRLRLTTVETTGTTVGRLYALSTVGSIVGTFAAGFVLIPFVGSVRTLYLIAGALMIVAVSLVPLAISQKTIGGALVLVFGIAATEVTGFLLLQKSGVHDIDTEYSRVQIFETIDSKTGRRMRALATDPYFAQSAMYLDTGEQALEYGKFYHLIRYYNPNFQNTLIIGGAGYSFPKEYLRTYADAKIDVVEIDPQMTQIARNFFDLQDDPRLTIFHEDGRMYINRAESNKYDAILMDAFGSLFSVPTHLTTIEAVREMHRILTDDGVVIFNLGSALTGHASYFFQAEFKTYQAVFQDVSVFKINQDYGPERLQNLIIVANKSNILQAEAATEPAIALLARRYDADLHLTKPILLDDLSPVEYYNSLAQDLFLANRNPLSADGEIAE
ncbi:MAG: fused MFS/spermidine synthase [Pyrinomonadaceae bacterium]